MKEEKDKEEGEENVYKEGTREDLVENDALTSEEEAFMKGYDEAANQTDEALSEETSKEEEESKKSEED